MKILMIGPQGSGKSTQASLLAEYLGTLKISTGDIFREMAQQGSQEGKKLKELLNSGKLVDDQTTAELVKKRVNGEDSKNGYVLDGYPRTIEQLKIFDPELDKVIYLEVPEEEVIKRLLARGREDDTDELIKTRLNLYYQQTQPLLDYYNNLGKLITIDGTGDVAKIQDEIRARF